MGLKWLQIAVVALGLTLAIALEHVLVSAPASSLVLAVPLISSLFLLLAPGLAQHHCCQRCCWHWSANVVCVALVVATSVGATAVVEVLAINDKELTFPPPTRHNPAKTLAQFGRVQSMMMPHTMSVTTGLCQVESAHKKVGTSADTSPI